MAINTMTITITFRIAPFSPPKLFPFTTTKTFAPHRRRLAILAAAPKPSRIESFGGADELFDEGDEFFDEDGDENDEGEGENGGAGEVFDEMRRWMDNRPRGFGEGKIYDTKIEDELWEEMERSRRATEAAKQKIRDGKAINGKQEGVKVVKEVDVIPYAARVRLWNLPRKKNILRDLKLAFKGFPGIVNISPAVLGNEKTRDPICKGFAFVDFHSEAAAQRFVQSFSQKSLLFGKVEKEISCSIINVSSSPGATDGMSTRSSVELQPKSSINSSNGSVLIPAINDRSSPVHISAKKEDKARSSSGEPTSSSQKQNTKGASKKKAAKKNRQEASKLALPRSFARLKVKERSVLTGILSGVLSKYSSEAVSEKQ